MRIVEKSLPRKTAVSSQQNQKQLQKQNQRQQQHCIEANRKEIRTVVEFWKKTELLYEED